MTVEPKERNVRSTGRGGRRSTTPPPLPYDAGVSALSAFPKEAGLGFRVTKRSIETTIAWLPMATGKPVASSPLVAPPPGARSKIKLAP